MGFGTQKIESIISDIFPEANISRLDTDVSQNSKKLNDVIQSFHNRKTDILIGFDKNMENIIYAWLNEVNKQTKMEIDIENKSIPFK